MPAGDLGGKQHVPVQSRAVVGLELQEFRGGAVRKSAICREPPRLACRLRRPSTRTDSAACVAAEKRVHVVLAVVAQTCREVHAFFGCDRRCHTGAVELHRKEMLLPRIILIRGEEYEPRLRPLPSNPGLRSLPCVSCRLQLGVGAERVRLVEAVEIKVRVAIAPAGPEKASPDLRMRNDVVQHRPSRRECFRSALCASARILRRRSTGPACPSARFKTSAQRIPSRTQPKRGT